MENYCTSGLAIDDNMAHAYCCSMSKTKNTQSEYETLIALPLQRWLRERA